MVVSLLRPEDTVQYYKKERWEKDLKNKGFVYVNLGFFSYFPPE